MIHDTFLQALASTMTGSSLDVPSNIGFTSTAVTLNPTTTTLSGEDYTRVSASSDRVLAVVTFNGLRSGAVASSTGDTINTIGLFDSSSGGDLYATASVANVNHTTSFDFEIDWSISLERE